MWCWVSLFFSPPSDCSSLPSTMTWAPCPHGVRTRGKKCCACHEFWCISVCVVTKPRLPRTLRVNLHKLYQWDRPATTADNRRQRNTYSLQRSMEVYKALPATNSGVCDLSLCRLGVCCLCVCCLGVVSARVVSVWRDFFSTSTDAVWAWCPGHH